MLLGAVIQIDKGTTLGPHLPFLTSDGMGAYLTVSCSQTEEEQLPEPRSPTLL